VGGFVELRDPEGRAMRFRQFLGFRLERPTIRFGIVLIAIRGDTGGEVRIASEWDMRAPEKDKAPTSTRDRGP